jgi:hypothetical protein
MNLQHLREVLELGFHDSAFEGLHPNLQTRAHDALSVLNRMVAETDAHHLSDLGLDGVNPHVTTAFFAAVDKTGEKAIQLGYRPLVGYLTERVDLYETPGPVIVTVGSEDSPRMALVIVRFTTYADSGYGDWTTAVGEVAGVFGTHDEAKVELTAIVRAIKTLKTVMNATDKRNEGRKASASGPSF